MKLKDVCGTKLPGAMRAIEDCGTFQATFLQFLAPAVTIGETERAMDSTSVFFASSFAYNFVRK